MSVAAGPFMIAAALLVVGGVAKTWRPADTALALRGAGMPVPSMAVRAGAILELAIGVYAIADGGRAAALLVGASYAAFSGFVALALARRIPLATCGCFGRADTPPDLLHLAVNAAALAAAVLIALDPGVGVADLVREQPLDGAPFLLLVVTGTFAALLALTSLPRTLALVRGDEL